MNTYYILDSAGNKMNWGKYNDEELAQDEVCRRVLEELGNPDMLSSDWTKDVEKKYYEDCDSYEVISYAEYIKLCEKLHEEIGEYHGHIY